MMKQFCYLRDDLITLFSVQRDGFIVPIHGSLINNKPRSNVTVYKTSKKRWLETFIQEGANKCPSPVVSPKHLYSPTRENITPEKEIASPGTQVCLISDLGGGPGGPPFLGSLH